MHRDAIDQKPEQLNQAWNQFVTTGDIMDYLRYKHLEDEATEVTATYAAQDQRNYPSGPNDAGGR